MRWVVFLQFLFLVVNSCQEFWQHWENVSCSSSADSCYQSKNFSSVKIFDQSLLIKCGEETIDSRLMRCLDVKNVQNITFRDCFLSRIDFGIFTFGNAIEQVQIWYDPYRRNRNFESALFNNMSSLRSVKIEGVRTSDLLNLTFRNVPSLSSLTIYRYNFTLFPNKPFRELINLSELYIMHGELRVLPEDLFYNLHNLTKLQLSFNNIESIHPLVFRNLTRLEYLGLELNRIKDLPSDMLKGLYNLRTFNINMNRELLEIPSGFFKKLHNLTNIKAQYCSISSLEEDVFSDLINLKIVHLDLNNIEHLPPNLLRNNKLLTTFSCLHNRISTLPTKIFHGLSELRELDLYGNQLENLPEDVFQNLSSLKTLDLSHNRLTFLHENIFLPLTNLTYLDLSLNNLTKLTGRYPFGSSKHLNFLKLINAGLTQWPVINWTEYNLTEVDFSMNHFETVKLPIYTPNRVKINLFYCKIKTIYLDEWTYGFEMPTYNLRNNVITCDDKLQQFVSFVKRNMAVAKEMFPNIENTKCYGENRNLLDITSFVTIGNYCPMNCECFAKQNDVMVNCSGKKIDRIPEVLVPNATIVDLSNNYIKDLSNVDCVTWRNVTHLRLSNNSISNISDYVLLPNLKYLWLDGNRLTQLPSSLMNLVDVSPEFKIYLSRNNWNCHCHSQFTKDWLIRNRQKIADFSDVYCGRNSSSVSFTEIVSNDGCTGIPEINLTSSVNASFSYEDCFDEVSSVSGWKIAVALLTSLLLFSWIVFAYFAYCRKKRNVDKVLKCKEEAMIYYKFTPDEICNSDNSLDEMRYVFFLQFLFLAVNSCREFWKSWENVSCTSSADSCYESKNFSSVKIFNQSLSIKCGEETIDSRMMRCLDIRNVQLIKFIDCFLSRIDFGIFTYGYGIEHVKIWNPPFVHKINFESASFNNMSSLRSVEIQNVKTSELLKVTFRNVPSLTSLEISLYNFTLFPNKPFRKLINLSELYITDGKLSVLPEDLFYNLHTLTKLDLSSNTIESIHPLVFRNLTKLEYLNLGNNQIKDLPIDLLKGLSNLRTFYTYANEISEIPTGFFKNMHNMAEINAWSCFFSSLEEDVFSDLNNLKTVRLDSNQIEHLPPNLLQNNKLLTLFSCSYNKISNLPTGIFHGLFDLRLLNFRRNRLENLPEDIFQNLSSLQHLDLSKNRLTFLHENIFFPLTNLTYLYLSYNNLTKLTGRYPFGSSKHLNYLKLNNAGLTQWPVINWTKYNLTLVDFSNNFFGTVKLPIYTPNRVKTDLSNCKIKTIYIDDRKYGFEMPTYDLSNNEISCNPELQQFVSLFKSNIKLARKMFPNIEYTKCFGEERNLLDNASFVVIGNYCPINCECFAEHNHVIVNCSGKGIDRIPDFLVPNATIVDLSNNYIKELPNVDCATWRNVTHLRLSNNSLSNISDYFLLPNLKFLWLDGNRLTELPSGLMNLVDVSPEFKIYLSRNNWNCHCHSQFTKDWLTRNRQKIADFSDVYCGRNSSSVSFTEIVSNDGCTGIPEINLTSSVNASSSNDDCFDEVSSVLGWKIAVAVLTSIMLFSWIVFAGFVYCRKKGNVDKVLKCKEEEVIYYKVSLDEIFSEFCTFVGYFSTYSPQIRVSNELELSLDEMRWVVFLQFLFLMVNCCQEFWKHWENVPCSSSADSCYESKNFSSVKIFDQSLLIKCGEETIDSRLMRCLDVRNVQKITFTDCFLSGIEFEIFTFGYAIERINIWYTFFYKRIFDSASFNNMSSLQSVEIRNNDLLNVTFLNVPSLTLLKIEWYNFTLFPNKPFRELINLSELYVTYGKLKVLPEDLFYNLHNLTKLDLSYNNIESIHPLVFRNLTRLEYLDLGWNQVRDLSSDMLKGISNLRTFYITGNRELSEIPSGFFKKLHNLTEISASSCSFSSLEEDVFFDLINLKKVFLNDNNIEHLPQNLLKNNKQLTKFSCSFNKIWILPTGIFNGLSELQLLNLKGNRLENLPEDIFQNLSSLQNLDLSKNRLTFLHENIFLPLTRLILLGLSNNKLTKLTGKRPFGSSKRLDYVNLNNAGLTQWPVINWTEYNLSLVDFSNNYFETVKLPIYTPNRMKIDLFNCTIKTIYIDEWKYGFQMPTYDLRYNKITCNYELQQFVSAFKSNIKVAKRMFPNIENTECYGEKRNLLDNTSFVVIGNYCPMNCECFAEHNHVIVNCSGKGIDRIPDFLVRNATIVDLSNNYIKGLSDVDCLTWKNVTHLRLSNNVIIYISDHVLLPNLKYLWLDGNRLTQLPSGLMNLVDVSPEFKLHLSRNNWNCRCHSLFIKDWCLETNRKFLISPMFTAEKIPLLYLSPKLFPMMDV
ncbi:uncharacterized protein [Centruroides vittatus]|uniref:uncharacterized protein n=1 Tax=Centruroides vittatus TaxID=120091 RepID=UPI00350F752E